MSEWALRDSKFLLVEKNILCLKEIFVPECFSLMSHHSVKPRFNYVGALTPSFLDWFFPHHPRRVNTFGKSWNLSLGPVALQTTSITYGPRHHGLHLAKLLFNAQLIVVDTEVTKYIWVYSISAITVSRWPKYSLSFAFAAKNCGRLLKVQRAI